MNDKKNILLVEDDNNLGFILQETLELNGFNVTHASNGMRAWDNYQETRFDLCLVDVMLPQKDGFTLAREIREAGSTVPILFLTAKSLKEDRISGFKIGGDDYITKPFSMEELLLRIKAVLKRTATGSPSLRKTEYHIGKYTFYPERQQLREKTTTRKLTSRESELLHLLCNHKNRLVSRKQALQTIWGEETFFTGRSMDVYISRLRKYLKNDPRIEIMNIHGKGFKLIDG